MPVSLRTLENLVYLDKYCDRTPIISTISNIIDIFIKTVVLPFKKSAHIERNPFYAHLKDKSFTRCAVLVVPVLGNVAVWLYDRSQSKYGNKDFILQGMRRDAGVIAKASKQLRDDPNTMLAAIKVSKEAYAHASERLRDDNTFRANAVLENNSVLSDIMDEEFLLTKLRSNGLLLEKISPSLQDKPNLVRAAIANNPAALQYTKLRNDPVFVVEELKNNGLLLQHASEVIQETQVYVVHAMHNNIGALQYSPLNKDREFVRKAINEHGGRVLEYADASLKSDRQFALLSLGKNKVDGWKPTAYSHIDIRWQVSPEFTREALLQNGWVLGELLEPSRNMEAFVAAACTHFPDAIVHAGPSLMKDRQFVLGQVRRGNALALKCAPDFQNDKELVIAAVEANGLALQYASPDLANNIEIVQKAFVNGPNPLVKGCPEAARYIGKDLLKNESAMIDLIRANPTIFKFLPTYQNNRQAVLALLAVDGMQLANVHADLQQNPEVVLVAVRQNGMALQYAHADLKKSWAIVLAAQTQNPQALTLADSRLRDEWSRSLSKIRLAKDDFKLVSPELKISKVFLKEAVLANSGCFEYFEDALRNDPGLVKSILTSSLRTYEFFKWAEQLRNDRLFVLEIISNNPGILKFCHPDIRADKEIVIKACQRNFRVLEDASDALQNDEDFVLGVIAEAGENFGEIYNHLSETLRQQKPFLLKALTKNVDIFSYFPLHLKKDFEIMTLVLKQNPEMFAKLDSSTRTDREQVKKLLSQNALIFPYLPPRFREDAELKKIANGAVKNS